MAHVNGSHAAEKLASEDDSAPQIQNPFFTPMTARPAAFKDRVPRWLTHFGLSDLKVLFKCSVAVWIATLFFLIDPVLRAYGQATFFGCLVLFIVPCDGIVLVQFLAATTIVIGLALAWAWGTIATKAALAARPAAETNARLRQLAMQAQATAPNTEQATGQSTYTQILVYNGFMLDTRVTATLFSMVLLFIYFMARLRARVPKFTLIALFSWIVSDIYLTIAPLLPTFNGTIAVVIVKPAATAVGIGLVCNILFFPKSTSYRALDSVLVVLRSTKGFYSACLSNIRPPFPQFQSDHLFGLQTDAVAAYKSFESSVGFLKLDFTICRWSPGDTASLKDSLRSLAISFVEINRFQRRRAKAVEKSLALNESTNLEDGNIGKGSHGNARLNEIWVNMVARFGTKEAIDVLHASFDSLVQAGAAELLESCEQATDALIEAVQSVNDTRWWKRSSPEQCRQLQQAHEQVLHLLKQRHDKFDAASGQALVDTNAQFFKDDLLVTLEDGQPTHVHGLFLSLVLAQRFAHTASVLTKMLTEVTQLESQRTKTRVWAPTGLHKLFPWIFGDEAVPMMSPLEHSPTATSVREQPKKDKKGKDADKKDAKPRPSNQPRRRSPLARIILGTTDWLFNDEGLFALRVVVASLAVAIPAATMPSAGFFYREKGLWALIMAQTGLAVYTSDFVVGFALRVAGTVLGGIIGMVCWYIGAGRGPGNPYGMAAVMAAAILVLMYCRLFAPPVALQGIIMLAATTYLVVAYSWTDTHIPNYGNPGVGYSVFWRRLLLALVGLAASFIVMLLPRPPSASRAHRATLAAALASSADAYTAWLDADAADSAALAGLDTAILARSIGTLETLTALAGPLALLRFELASTPFDAASLQRVRGLATEAALALATLVHVFAAAPVGLRRRFAARSAARSPDMLADVCAVLAVCGHALATGEPLPAALPGPLVAKATDGRRAGGAALDEGEAALERSVVAAPEFREFCIMLSAFVNLLGATDELVRVLREVVGTRDGSFV